MLAVLAGVAVLTAVSADAAPLSEAAVPADALRPSGSPLPDGLTVPHGAQLIGTPLEYDPVSRRLPPDSWTAVLLVTGDPIATWSAMVDELSRVLGGPHNDEVDAPGCATYDGFFGCSIDTGGPGPAGAPLQVYADMRPVPGDVTGHYSLVMYGRQTDQPMDTVGQPWAGGPAPPPPPARDRPRVGDPLAPETAAYDDDDDRYVLLQGTELLVQYSPGSFTGGFGVLLRVRPGADVQEISAAYAEQARQYDGVTKRRVSTNEDSTVYGFAPSGGAGGYQGEVFGVDNEEGADYIYYSLIND